MDTNSLETLLKEHLKQDQSRLDRIEIKIDKLSETVIALARAEEKLITLESNRLEVGKRLDAHDERLDRHSERLNSGAVTLNTIQKVFWLIVSAAIATIVGTILL